MLVWKSSIRAFEVTADSVPEHAGTAIKEVKRLFRVASGACGRNGSRRQTTYRASDPRWRPYVRDLSPQKMARLPRCHQACQLPLERILALVGSLTGNAESDSSMLWELIKMSRRYELSILRERSAARATVTGWLSRVMIRPVGVLGSRATPSWMNSERRW